MIHDKDSAHPGILSKEEQDKQEDERRERMNRYHEEHAAIQERENDDPQGFKGARR